MESNFLKSRTHLLIRWSHHTPDVDYLFRIYWEMRRFRLRAFTRDSVFEVLTQSVLIIWQHLSPNQQEEMTLHLQLDTSNEWYMTLHLTTRNLSNVYRVWQCLMSFHRWYCVRFRFKNSPYFCDYLKTICIRSLRSSMSALRFSSQLVDF